MAPNPPFRLYGKEPPFELDEFKDTFELWQKKWEIFLKLSTIDTTLPEAERGEYKANKRLSCLSTTSLQAILTMGLSSRELNNHAIIITKLRERCNAGRNKHVWRQQFSTKKQEDGQAADDWLCELRDIARKCKFVSDCCANCDPTRILGQVVAGVRDDEARVKLLDKGKDLTLDSALTTLRTAEAAGIQATSIKHGDAAAIQATRSAHQKAKQEKRNRKGDGAPTKSKQTGKTKHANSEGCRNCGASTRHALMEFPAHGQNCNKCSRLNHFARVCKSQAKKDAWGKNDINSIHAPSASPRVAEVATDRMFTVTIFPRQVPTSTVQLSSLPDSSAEIDAIPLTSYEKNLSGTLPRKAI